MKATNDDHFVRRLMTYLAERFPIIQNGLVIAVFTFSAIAYSRICAGKSGFVNWRDYLLGFIITFTLFLLVRILDEFKDREDDAKYRQYLPVPRGLIKLKELQIMAWLILVVQGIVVLIYHPTMWFLYLLVMTFLGLMTVEFFVPKWLKKHQLIYITSHMLIMPLVDLYASGIDWHLAGESPSTGLFWFYGVSFFNGIVLEVGRKMKTPDHEEEGVVSYTKLFGLKKAPIYWILILFVTFCLSIAASYFAEFSNWAYVAFSVLFLLATIPAIMFHRRPSQTTAKSIEVSSALWTLFMYLFLGAIPMVSNLIQSL